MTKTYQVASDNSFSDGPVEIRRGKRLDSDSDDENQGSCKGARKCILSNLMLLFLLLGIITGIVLGACLRINYNWSDDQENDADRLEAKRKRMYLGFPGELFLRMLKCMIIPLIVSSLISGLAGLPTKSAGKIGGLAVAYYMLTTLLAVILGIVLVVSIKPGSYALKGPQKERIQEGSDFILDLVRNVFPPNIISATFHQSATEYTTDKMWGMVNVTIKNETTDQEFTQEVNRSYSKIMDFKPRNDRGGSNILGLVVFSVVLGIVVGNLGEKARVFREAVDGFSLAIIEMVRLVIWFAPIGICFLLAERIVRMKDPLNEFAALGVYMGTVAAGLLIHGFIFLPLIYLIFTRRNPFKFGFHMMKALVNALGTASSSATLPITLRCMEYNAGVDPRIAMFMLPVGATINMDGTALYEAVASIFIAQINNIQLDAGQTITVAITATAAAIGAAGVPEAGLVTMSIVLSAVGLPLEDVALILAVDWLLDRLRTTINVWGDSIGCGVVESLCRKELAKMDEEDAREAADMTKAEMAKRESGIGHYNAAYDSAL
jgi:Na+/H+-dicarboxylate symporter